MGGTLDRLHRARDPSDLGNDWNRSGGMLEDLRNSGLGLLVRE